MKGAKPANGRDGLKAYDPEAFTLLDDFYSGRMELTLHADPITNVIPDAARPLPLSAVRLTGGPLKHAQDLDAKYLLALEPDRMLAGYRLRAGLEPKAKGYGGWDSVNGKQLTGHIAGHYLSAVSLMYAATGDPRFKERADYLVKELKEVQDKRGNGYLGAITDHQGTDGEAIFERVAKGDIRSGGFDLNGMWSPWYTLHKTFAGLRDAYRYTGNPTALELEIKFAKWAEGIVGRMTDAQVQRMLNTEFGGMNEVLADLYADTGDPRWLALSYKFEHRAFTEPLKRHQDNLAGKHGNTQVPKMIGSLARFAYTGDPGDGYAASFFWDRVVQHHSYATGGHGKDEYFGEPDKLSDRVDGRTAETCNVYNMLKMTRQMFALRPDAHYADFHERALFNHILASQDPQDGWACYMVPVGRGVQHEYEQNMLDGGFTCCTGSSMESHALHGLGLYYESGDKLWVNLYAPSTAEWQAAGVKLSMETDFPEGESATLHLTVATPKELTIALRRPYWAGTNFSVKVNGEPVAPSCWLHRLRWRGRRGTPFRARVELVRRTQAHLEDRRRRLPSRCPRPSAWNRCRTTLAASPSSGARWCSPATSARRKAGVGAATTAKCPSSSAPSGPWPTGSSPLPDKAGLLPHRRRGQGSRRGFRPLLSPPPPHLRHLLGPVHTAGMGPARHGTRRRTRTAAQARSRHRRLRPARRDASRARRQHAGRGHRARPPPGPRRPPRRQVVLLRSARRSRPSHGAGRHLQPRRVAGAQVRYPGGRRARRRADHRAPRPHALLRRGIRRACRPAEQASRR